MRIHLNIFYFSVLLSVAITSVLSAQDQNSRDKLSDQEFLANIDRIDREILKVEFSNPDSAIKIAIRALVIAEPRGNDRVTAAMLARLGAIYFRKNNFVSAIEFYLRAYPIALKLNDPGLSGYLLIDIGNSHYQQGLYREAMDFYYKSLEFFNSDSLLVGRAVGLNNLGLSELKLREYDTGEDYFQKGMQIRRKIGMRSLILHSYGYLIDAKRLKHDFSNAEKLLDTALTFASDEFTIPGEQEVLIEFFRKTGLLYHEMKQFNKALYYYNRAQTINLGSLREKNLLARVTLDIGNVYKSLHNNKEYEKFLKEALKIARAAENNNLVKECYADLSRYYASLKDLTNSLRYSNRLIRLMEEENKSAIKSRLFDLLLFINTTDKETQIRLKELELASETEKKNRAQLNFWIIAAALLLISSFSGLLFVNYKRVKKLNRELRERNEEILKQREEIQKQKTAIEEILLQLQKSNTSRDKFYSVFVHDLKNPLHTLVACAEILSNEGDELSDKEKAEFSSHVFVLSKKVNTLIMEMLEWLSIQLGKTVVEIAPVDPADFINAAINRVRASAEKKSIAINSVLPSGMKVFGDITSLTSIFQNLLDNAIKFSHPGSVVDVITLIENDRVLFNVRDKGLGFSAARLDKFRNNELLSSTEGTAKESGTGFGLMIIKDMIKLNNGEITLESEEGKGSTFVVSLALAEVSQKNREADY